MGEVQSARHPSFEPRAQSQGSADDSDTPGTRALWSKLREIALRGVRRLAWALGESPCSAAAVRGAAKAIKEYCIRCLVDDYTVRAVAAAPPLVPRPDA